MEQLLELKTKNIVTFCPYCDGMLYDAIQTKEVTGVEVLDIAEIIASDASIR